MSLKAIIFDMDGLIADTEILEHKSLMKFLKEHGKEPNLYPNGLVHKIGGGPGYYEEFLDRHSIKVEDLEKLKNKKIALFEQTLREEGIIAFPGFIELLKVLKNEGFILAIASNRREKLTHLILEMLEVKEFFSLIVGPSENIRRKPYPDIYIHAAKELGVEPQDCIVLEDTSIGIISAKEAGMKAIAIPNIYTSGLDFRKADLIVKSLLDVNVGLLKSL
jgi:HAD superfamily hydrolase (TIGR01509 family)